MFAYRSAPGRPSNVTLDSVSQYSIIVYIAQPLPSERNGVIRGYTVLYRQTGLTEADYLSVNTTSSPLTLANLTVFTEYSIQAAAFTRAGLGTKSEVKTIVTQEGGKPREQSVFFLPFESASIVTKINYSAPTFFFIFDVFWLSLCNFIFPYYLFAV